MVNYKLTELPTKPRNLILNLTDNNDRNLNRKHSELTN